MNNLPHGEKKKLAVWLGLKKSDLASIITGRYRPGPAKAIRLSDKTGISLRIWLSRNPEMIQKKLFAVWRERN